MQTFRHAGVDSAPPSRWPVDGSWLDRLDKRLSAPLLQLQLGLPLEIFLSVPGCFLGMPAFLAIAPSIVAAAHDPSPSIHSFTALVLGGTLLLLTAWAFVLAGGEKLALLLFSMRIAILAPLVGIWLVEINPGLTAKAVARAHLLLFSWFLALIPIVVLKATTRRRRPIACKEAHIGQASATAANLKRCAREAVHAARWSRPAPCLQPAICVMFVGSPSSDGC
jgi:hypothetical protein